jgi:hypothetical protein
MIMLMMGNLRWLQQCGGSTNNSRFMDSAHLWSVREMCERWPSNKISVGLPVLTSFAYLRKCFSLIRFTTLMRVHCRQNIHLQMWYMILIQNPSLSHLQDLIGAGNICWTRLDLLVYFFLVKWLNLLLNTAHHIWNIHNLYWPYIVCVLPVFSLCSHQKDSIAHF